MVSDKVFVEVTSQVTAKVTETMFDQYQALLSDNTDTSQQTDN